jgi:PRTRC genetic system protein E
MFQAIYDFAKTTTLTMLISANTQDGTLTLCVKPTPRKGVDAALAKELTLTGKPEEFDQAFPRCLTAYATQHQSLMEQAAATAAVLEATKQAQVEKGTKAATAAAKGKALPAATPVEAQATPPAAAPQGEVRDGEEAHKDNLFD